MLKKPVNHITKMYRKASSKAIFLFYLIAAFTLRFPFFFRDYVDRDESTFILMGQAWVDGFLPYTELWDLKPPVTFLFFGGLIYFFGKSFFAIRFAGTVVVTLTALMTFLLGKELFGKKAGFWSGLLVVLLYSLFGSVQGVMSEHLSSCFFMAALFLLATKKGSLWNATAGVLLGLTIMTKLNMGYALVSIFLGMAWFGLKTEGIWSTLKKLVWIGCMVLVVVYATAIPYQNEGLLHLWWQSVFEAPLAYSGSKNHSVFDVLPLVLGITALMGFGIWKKLVPWRSFEVALLLLATLGILFSFLQIGKVNGHYLLQVYPFLALFLAMMVAGSGISLKPWYKPVALLALVLLPVESYLEYAHILKAKNETGSFYNGEGFDVPHYFEAKDIAPQRTLFLEYHIGYWIMDQRPPTKAATHPSNLVRDELFPFMLQDRTTVIEELRFIMEDVQPDYVVTRKNRTAFDKEFVEANRYIESYLANAFKVIDTVDHAVIHHRIKK